MIKPIINIDNLGLHPSVNRMNEVLSESLTVTSASISANNIGHVY